MKRITCNVRNDPEDRIDILAAWLLDKAAFDALDEIIDEQWARLEAHRKRRIDNAVRRGAGARLQESPTRTQDSPRASVK